jgi:hypothetical protein
MDYEHDYRLYVYDKAGQLLRAPMLIISDDDETAIKQAEALRDVDAVYSHVMDGKRLVMRISHNE